MKKSIVQIFLACFLALSLASVVQAGKKMKIQGIININTASPEQLKLFPRVGPKIANRIIRFRKKSKFSHARDIMKVKGIGHKTFAKMRKNITTTQATKFHLAKK